MNTKQSTSSMSIRAVQYFQFSSQLLYVDHKQSEKPLKVPNLQNLQQPHKKKNNKHAEDKSVFIQ